MAREGDGSVLVAWCPNCHWYLEVREVGCFCPGNDCNFHLRRRRGYIDENSEDKNIYWTKCDLRMAGRC